MKRIAILLLTVLTVTAHGQSQSDKEKAYELGEKAVQQMDAGQIKEALDLLEEAHKLDPENMNYPYETAYAHYLNKDYKSGIKVLKKLTKHNQVNDRVWQMLGNCYDMNKDPEQAIKTYEKGLTHFPNSGSLYLERGNMELLKKEYDNALGYYEQGIKVDPAFPSNYYWATRIHISFTEKVWGMLYGELFINLERNSGRTAEISKLLYDTYKSEITFTSDTSASVSFCQNMTITIGDLSDPNNFKLPFCMVYEPTLLLAVQTAGTIDLNSLDKIRTTFVKNYYSMGHSKTHPNALFEYQKEILENGHFKAYNHWILMKGDEAAFLVWQENNKDKWDNFVNWFSENPIELSTENQFYSGQY
ncbi:MAG: hypothetical protein CL843_07715 [Crocinitomicaceae bacterium]|nr:hypothetical protein [Crocinitomicaceae bacterium]|tara:strand:+ start:5055 stop:6134 length:1080 start_codon:yes stop_codon:yes gene_type:complete